MNDRTFASGGDSGSGRTPYGGGAWPQPSSEAAAVGVARRLQGRLDRHLWLLGQVKPEPPQLRELSETVRRMRRDVESIVLLNGDDPSGHTGGPRRLPEVLDDAAAAAEETWRILVRPAAGATVEPGAAVELIYVLAELLDHVTAAFPDAGIDVASYVTAHTGLSVEVAVTGASRFVPDGLGTRRAAAAAEAHARRSRSRLMLTLPAGATPAGGTGVVATLSCPAAAVTLEEPAWSSVVATDRQPFTAVAPGVANGHGNGLGHNGWGDSWGHSAGSGVGTGPVLPEQQTAVPQYSPSAYSGVDELFGPMIDLQYQGLDEHGGGTPIFEAIASAWFREGRNDPEAQGPGAAPVDWETPSDVEWREAAARAAAPDPLPATPSGLPRRRPGSQLVPPPRSASPSTSEPAERVPDRVRNRLSTYQRGLRQGRHRAPGPDPDHW